MEDLRERVEAVERALTDGNGDLTALAEGAASAERVEELSTEVASLQEEVAELSAATQALRGYVGNVRSVNESVEERADAAVAAVESLEERLEQHDSDARPPTEGHGSAPPTATESTTHRHQPTAAEGRDSATTACSACGRPAEGAATPDGGRNHGLEAAGDPARSPTSDSAPTAGSQSSTRESVAGFDPNARGGQVTIREEPAEDELRATGEGRDTAGGNETSLVDRMRELL
jgi:outer membrane murein-binding lipoprotein Lpp